MHPKSSLLVILSALQLGCSGSVTAAVMSARAGGQLAFTEYTSGGTYNPLAAQNLQAVVSADCDYEKYGWTESSHAAAYGTDSSNTPKSIIDRAFAGLGIEPMAHSTAEVAVVDPSHEDLWLGRDCSAWGSASAEVRHRVVVSPKATSGANSELLSFLQSLSSVPVRLHYRLSVSESASNYVSGTADFSIRRQDGMYVDGRSQSGPGEQSGILKFTVDYTAVYKIRAGTLVTAFGWWSDVAMGSSGTAVADPFLQADPDWMDPVWGPLARYFMVEQESLLDADGWEEVTRTWMPLSLTAVRAPSGSQIQLTVLSAPGESFALEKATYPAGASWTTLLTTNSPSGSLSVTLPMAGGSQFYRALRIVTGAKAR